MLSELCFMNGVDFSSEIGAVKLILECLSSCFLVCNNLNLGRVFVIKVCCFIVFLFFRERSLKSVMWARFSPLFHLGYGLLEG